ncbi:MAG: T9SS type A sorting domain-containing protein [Ferruginibacter sp.]|nr:T9SS type A sorting domain-containing protein [Ferruginibacter sp.]
MKKFLLSASMCVAGMVALAQFPTTTINANNCSVFRNFNTSDEGFSSPSIYSSDQDVAFNWSQSIGAEVESSGLASRSASLISPVYTLASQGQATIGFRYAAPAGTQYRIRIISGVANPPLEILATTANGPVYNNLPSTSGNICLQLFDQDLIAGGQIRFEFTFRVVNQPGIDIIFDDLAISVQGGPLPVTFEGFVARKLDNGALKLLWNVGDEINVKGYDVEVSNNGRDFTTTGYVTATGKNVYSLNYTDKLNGTVYFRVKNIDFDGKTKYSAIIKIYSKEISLSQIEIYPMPARDMVTIQHNLSAERANITLYSNDGKLIMQKLVLPNTLQTQLNLINLNSGLYIVRYDNGKGTIESKNLYKN